MQVERRQTEGKRLIVVGGGLSAALIALRMADRPNVSVTILETEIQPFGKHTWSFHISDLEKCDRSWLEPAIAHQWAGQTVRFQDYTRHLPSGYATLTSQSVRAVIERIPNVEIRSGVTAESVGPRGIGLSNGETVYGDCVIDARGYRQSSSLTLGYQKFIGLEVEVAGGHGLIDPVIMDATVDQIDGYRFVYLLPFSPTRVLIEDTRYSDDHALSQAEIEQAIHEYARMQGWAITHIVRREQGVLPISLAYDARRFWSETPRDVPQVGMRAALFHPTTGYSLPEAVGIANLIANVWPTDSAKLAEKIRRYALDRHREQWFYRLLNRMLFLAAKPNRRHLVLQRFYRLPIPLIERFYAGRTAWPDIARILVGKPPVPIHRAVACLNEKSFLRLEKS